MARNIGHRKNLNFFLSGIDLTSNCVIEKYTSKISSKINTLFHIEFEVKQYKRHS